MKFKYVTSIAKILLAYMIISLAVIFVFEMSRMRETQETMMMFSRIAGNYALTASQDAGVITASDYVRDYGASKMYSRNEYGIYLEKLKQSADSTGDSSLLFVYNVLYEDYVRACNATYGEYLDNYLKYTPISFNYPYISKSIIERYYSEALIKMVSNYKCKGRPSAFVPASDAFGFNSSSVVVI